MLYVYNGTNWVPLFQFSESDTIPPEAPTGFSVSPGDGVNVLTWTDPGANDLDGIRIYRSTTQGSGHTLLTTVNPGVEQYDDEAVTNDTTYYYYLTAIDVLDNESTATAEEEGTPSAEPEVPPSEILLIVGSVAPLSNGDANIKALLEGTGATVTERLASATEADTSGYTLVVISESVSSGDIGSKYSTVSTPLVTLENAAWDEANLASSADSFNAVTTVDIADDTHPIAAGLSGNVQVLNGNDQRAAPNAGLGPDAHVIFRPGSGNTGHAGCFVYEQGDEGLNSTIFPARRVALGWRDGAMADNNLRTAGENIFLAACTWAQGFELGSGGGAGAGGPTSVLLVVGSLTLNSSETAVVSRLTGQGWTVDSVLGSAVTVTQANSYALVIISKTVSSASMGASLKATTSGVIFWEDNLQALAYMATIDDSDESDTFWHHTAQQACIHSGIPAGFSDLAAGLTPNSAFNLYTSVLNQCWSPPNTLGPGAQPIAKFQDCLNERDTIYAYDAGGELADGTLAAGRRVFFGLYDDTFTDLTTDGLALWDAAVEWAKSP